MIDTDKHEGLSRFDLVEQHNIHELAIFLLDQLAEVKRLRKVIEDLTDQTIIAHRNGECTWGD
tara:strand:+ start:254 stop:442 length:189 start_codon:yes stop_codon:yes gene_type:complete